MLFCRHKYKVIRVTNYLGGTNIYKKCSKCHKMKLSFIKGEKWELKDFL